MARAARHFLIVGLGLTLAGLAGCADPPAPNDNPTPTTSVSTPTPEPTLDGASTDPITAASDAFGLLAKVRVAGREGYDRVVFEFADGALPGYTIQYVDLPVTQDGSGNPVDLPGAAAAVQIAFTPASGYDLNGTPPGPTYEGPKIVTADNAAVLIQAAAAGDFEARLTWAVGLPGRVPFVVKTLTGPARVVIDFQAP